MSINVSNLELTIAKNLAAAHSPEDNLIYAKAMQQLRLGIIKVVNTITDLPSPSSVEVGSIYFVKADSFAYIADGSTWRYITNPATNWIFGWGSNSLGQLGDGSSLNKSSPVSVVGPFPSEWKQINAANYHTTGIRKNGTLWAWGYNAFGQLGDNTTVSKSSAVSVVGGFTDWCQVSGSSGHTLAIRTNGTLWAWGDGNSGRLGDGTIVNKSSPVSVVGGFTDWCQVSAGRFHSLAIRSNGTVWSWGCATNGQLGDNTTVSKSSPVSVVGGFTDWCQASAGSCHSVGVRTNGTLWAWGANSQGQLGDNSTTMKSSPVSVVGGFTDWCQISGGGGGSFSAAIRTNGTLWAWGYNNVGQLGDNSITSRSSPVSVVGGFTDWCNVSAGVFHMSAVRTNGTAWAWGCNNNGQLGDNTIVNKSSPVSVVGGFTTWTSTSAGRCHTFGIVNRP